MKQNEDGNLSIEERLKNVENRLEKTEKNLRWTLVFAWLVVIWMVIENIFRII